MKQVDRMDMQEGENLTGNEASNAATKPCKLDVLCSTAAGKYYCYFVGDLGIA